MPFLPDDDDLAPVSGLTPQLAAPVEVSVPTPPFSRLWEAAQARESTIGSLKEWARWEPMSAFDASFDPFKSIRGYEDYARSFIDANDDDDVLRIKSRIDQERRREELLAGSATGWIAAMAAGFFDPINLIPIGGGAYTIARTGARLARMAQGAGRLGAAAGAGQAAQEIGLQATQLTRPWEEFAIAVGQATPLGGLRGGIR